MFQIRRIASDGTRLLSLGLSSITALTVVAALILMSANGSAGVGLMEGRFDKQTKAVNLAVTYLGWIGPVRSSQFQFPTGGN
jgi:hypothetical protein